MRWGVRSRVHALRASVQVVSRRTGVRVTALSRLDRECGAGTELATYDFELGSELAELRYACPLSLYPCQLPSPGQGFIKVWARCFMTRSHAYRIERVICFW